jgi:hypothetical protein
VPKVRNKPTENELKEHCNDRYIHMELSNNCSAPIPP